MLRWYGHTELSARLAVVGGRARQPVQRYWQQHAAPTPIKKACHLSTQVADPDLVKDLTPGDEELFAAVEGLELGWLC